MQQQRFESFDSLRGIAALTVVMSHLNLEYFHMDKACLLLHRSVFHVVYDGAAAVIFFFVLSGFVLSYKYVSKGYQEFDKLSFSTYLISRIFRIYPLVLAVLVVSALVGLYVPHSYETFPARQFTYVWWGDTFHWLSTLKQFTLIYMPSETSNFYAPQTWTLKVEVIFSSLVPVLILLSRRHIGWLLLFNLLLLFLFNSMVYIIHFTMGLALARYLPQVNSYMESKSRRFKIGLLLTGIFLYSYNYSVAVFFPQHSVLEQLLFNNWGIFLNGVIGTGVVMILVAVLHSTTLKKILNLWLIKLAGKISYSIYLCHFIVFVIVTPLVLKGLNDMGVMNHLLLVIVATVVTLVGTMLLSYIFYHTVELRGIEWGKKAVAYFRAKGGDKWG